MFIYDGAAALGNLVVAIVSDSGTDPFGNDYSGPGNQLSAPGPGGSKSNIQLRPDLKAMLVYA